MNMKDKAIKVEEPVVGEPRKTSEEIVPPLDHTPTNPKVEESQHKIPKGSDIVVWQCKTRRYREITPFVEENAELTRSGVPVRAVIKARNWRVQLNLKDPLQKKMHEHMLKDKTGSYVQLKDKGANTKITEDAATLQKLMEMSTPQLMQCIEAVDLQELQDAGIIPGHANRFQLIAVVLKKHKLDTGGKK